MPPIACGLGWARLGCVGLGWAGLGWVGTDWVGLLGWAGGGLDFAGDAWAGLGWAGGVGEWFCFVVIIIKYLYKSVSSSIDLLNEPSHSAIIDAARIDPPVDSSSLMHHLMR